MNQCKCICLLILYRISFGYIFFAHLQKVRIPSHAKRHLFKTVQRENNLKNLHLFLLFRFNQILCQRSFAHLRAVFDEYQKISKKTMEQVIKSEFSGDIKDGFVTVGK